MFYYDEIILSFDCRLFIKEMGIYISVQAFRRQRNPNRVSIHTLHRRPLFGFVVWLMLLLLFVNFWPEQLDFAKAKLQKPSSS